METICGEMGFSVNRWPNSMIFWFIDISKVLRTWFFLLMVVLSHKSLWYCWMVRVLWWKPNDEKLITNIYQKTWKKCQPDIIYLITQLVYDVVFLTNILWRDYWSASSRKWDSGVKDTLEDSTKLYFLTNYQWLASNSWFDKWVIATVSYPNPCLFVK